MHDKYYVVLDTNVLVSALLGASRMSVPTKVLKAVMDNREDFPDPKDIIFYEVSLSKEGSYLVTGNLKHFPQKSFIITPAQMLELLKEL